MKKIYLLLIVPFLMLGCQKENLEIQPQEKLPIETVGDKEALEFLNNLNLYKTSQKEVQFVALQLDKMTREKLINSDQMLTVIPATTIYKDHYSRVLLLKLDGELRSVVFSMYAADGRQGEYFSGEILITGLNGEFINGYRASNGTLISKFIKKKWDAKSHRSLKSTGDFCPDHGMCEVGSLCNFCLQTLDEVELTGGGSTDSGISLGGIYPDYKTESGDFNSEQETISWIAEGGAGGSTTTTTEEEEGPSCESFSFSNTTSNWQEAAVKNIQFKVVLLSPQGAKINHYIVYSNPILFGMPSNMIIGGEISNGMAAELSAKALQISMDETVARYGNQEVDKMIVSNYFEQRLKNNYPIITNGGRVNFNPMSYSVVPTYYKTAFLGNGNCE